MEKLNQKEYSDFILKKLTKFFPKFKEHYRFEQNTLIIEYPSPSGNIEFWISTQDLELTVGFDQDNQCIWHTHASQFGAFDPDNELAEVVKLTNRIFDGKEKIIFDLKNGAYLTDSPEKSNETEIKTWKEL